jgi:hypothetical protein
MNCLKCQSTRSLEISARSKDQTTYTMNGREYEGYAHWFGSGDELELTICLTCGQVQDEFPYPKIAELEEPEYKVGMSKEQWDVVQELLEQLENDKDERADLFQETLPVEMTDA